MSSKLKFAMDMNKLGLNCPCRFCLSKFTFLMILKQLLNYIQEPTQKAASNVFLYKKIK